jgi:hypothetical protein
MLFIVATQAIAVALGSFKGLFGLEWGDSMETILKKAYNMGWTPDVSVPKERLGDVSALNFKAKLYEDDKARISAVFYGDAKTLSLINMTFAKRAVYNDFRNSLKQYPEVTGYKGPREWTGAHMWRVGYVTISMGIITKTHEVSINYIYDNDFETTSEPPQ